MSQSIAHRKKSFAAILLAAVMLVLVGLLPALPAHAEGEDEAPPLSSVELIHDDADILDDQRVVDALNQLTRLDELEDTQVAVYTSDEVSKNNYDKDITELIKADDDPLVMDDGLVRENIIVVTISPGARQIGVYAREGSPLESKSAVRAATSEMTSYAQNEDWDNAIFTGASTYLETLDVATRNDPAVVAEERKAQSDALNQAGITFAIFVGSALVLLVVIYIIRTMNANARRNRKIKTLQDTSRSVLEAARKDWSALKDIKEATKVIPTRLIRERIQLLTAALNPNGKPNDFKDIDEHSVEVLLDPRSSDPDIDTLLALSSYPSADGERAWKEALAETEGEIQGIREIDEEIEALGLPDEIAERIRTKAQKTIAVIDKEITDVEKKGRDVDALDSLAYISELIEDFQEFSTKSVRSMSKDEYAQIITPRRSSSTDSWDSHGFLFPAYAMGIYAMTASSHSSSGYYGAGSGSSSLGGHSSSPTSFSSGFSGGGGGFSGGSSGF